MAADADHRLLGARDGLVSGMLVIRRELGRKRERLRMTPAHHVRRRAALQETIDMLTRMDTELDYRRKECQQAWNERMSVEIVSTDRPAPVNPI